MESDRKSLTRDVVGPSNFPTSSSSQPFHTTTTPTAHRQNNWAGVAAAEEVEGVYNATLLLP